MKTTRLEAFSDGVLAIIITIMVLELKPPHDPTLGALANLWPTFFAYALSFVMVAIYWVNHHHLIHLVTDVNAVVLWANINLLFWLSLFPWATAYMGQNHMLPFPVALYAAVAVLAAVAFSILRAVIMRQNDGPKFATIGKLMWKKNVSAIAIYSGAVLAAFFYVPLALVLIALPAAMYFFPEKRIEKAVK